MPKILITFTEEGQEPVSVELNESTSAILDRFVADQNAGKEESAPPVYYGKADLFMKHTVASLILPLVSKYKTDVEFADTKIMGDIAVLEEQKAVLEQSLKAKFIPSLVASAADAAAADDVTPPTKTK